jgi:hypothetical protein
MFAGAPPMLVVGLAVRVALVGAQLLVFFDSRPRDQMIVAAIAGTLVGDLMITAGTVELMRRSRGGARIGAAIASCAYGIGCVATVAVSAYVAYMQVWRLSPESYAPIMELNNWVWPLIELVGVLGLALAVDAGGLAIAVLALVVTVVVRPIPPLTALWNRFGRDEMVIAAAVLSLGQMIACVLLAARIAERAAPPRHASTSGLRAASGIRIAIAGLIGRALLGAASIAWGIAGAPRYVVGGYAIDALDLVSAGVLTVGLWRWAQAQVPTMPRYLVHVALACVLGGLIGLLRVVQDWLVVMMDSMAFVAPWWIELGALLGLACAMVAIVRYVRHAPALALRAWLCAGLVGLEIAITYVFRSHDIVPGVCAILANLAAIPALRATATTVAADPIKSTADVFA